MKSVYLLVLTLGFLACSGPSDVPHRVVSVSNTVTLVTDQHGAAETYQPIRKNVARLHAMLNGKFVQYKGSSAGEFSTWKVNDGKDSIVMCSVPIGKPNKDGYWLFHYQYMTSLPDEPLYMMFERYVELSRDSIRSFFSRPPEGFTTTLGEVTTKPHNLLKIVPIKTLKASQNPGSLYIRKTPLLFVDNSIVENEEKGEIYEYTYQVSPGFVYYKTVTTTKGEASKSSTHSRFVKLGIFQ